MRCYYEVLGVKQDVGEEELRKSYRRLALQLHPDKNLNNEEEAKAKFQEVQGAYEVLSDPQERAFYDRNRESILHGEESSGGGLKEEIHLYKYFSTSCFAGYNDTETGFYTVYRRAFESISVKDMKYMDEEDICIPTFGRSDTDLEDVAEFYGYWQSYCTSMSFCWFDKYDIRQAQNRWVEKRIEKENKKIRDKFKKEFNEEVRSLVSFVRKRDKRWEARRKQLEEKVAENERKQSEFQMKQREERRKWVEETMEAQKESLLQYERQLKEMESQYAEEWGLSEESVTDPEEEEEENLELMMEGLYCIACEKLFKSDKAFKNHEQSRKHQEKQATLATLMKEEESTYTNGNHDIEEGEHISLSSEEDVQIVSSSSSKKKKKKKKTEVEKDLSYSEPISRKKNSRKNKQNLVVDLEHLRLSSESSDTKIKSQEEDTIIKSQEEETTIEEKDQQKEVDEEKDCDGSSVVNNEDTKPKLKGKKAKEAKKKAQQENQRESQEPMVENICSFCNEKFASKNKLFNHLKTTGHAAPKVSNSKSKKTKR